MKYRIASAVKTEVVGQVGEHKRLSMEANVKAFRVVIDGLYPEKIASPIRELMTNALDAHIDAGCADRPFEVWLPSIFDPTFRVRDYGNSMSEEVIEKVYSVLFCSTKDKTDDMTGMLGIGSKSPYAYTNSFNVTCYLNGEARVYEWGLAEDGSPDFYLMAQGATDEEDGVEVSFHVDETDFKEFRRKTSQIAIGFDVLPIFKCGSESDLELPSPAIKMDRFRYYTDIPHVANGVYIRQGPVIYPVSRYSAQNNDDRETDFPYKIFSTPGVLIVDVDIGQCDVTASRDALSYTAYTKENLKRALIEVSERFRDNLGAEIEAMDTYEEACLKYVELSGLCESYSVPFEWRGETLTVERADHEELRKLVKRILITGVKSLAKQQSAGFKRLKDISDVRTPHITEVRSDNTIVFVATADDRKSIRLIGPRLIQYFTKKYDTSISNICGPSEENIHAIVMILQEGVVFDRNAISVALNHFDPDNIHSLADLPHISTYVPVVRTPKPETGSFTYFIGQSCRTTYSIPSEVNFIRSKGRSDFIFRGRAFKRDNMRHVTHFVDTVLNSKAYGEIYAFPKNREKYAKDPKNISLDDEFPRMLAEFCTREELIMGLSLSGIPTEEFEIYKGVGDEEDITSVDPRFKSLAPLWDNSKVQAISKVSDFRMTDILLEAMDVSKGELDYYRKWATDTIKAINADYPMIELCPGYTFDSRNKTLEYINQMIHYRKLLAQSVS